MLRASYSLAFYALLRPTEYMLTPRHNKFDECRHMRACDIQFKYKGRTITTDAPQTPDSFSVNIKMSKNDQTRDGSTAPIHRRNRPEHMPGQGNVVLLQAGKAASRRPTLRIQRIRTTVLLRAQSATDAHRSRRLPLRPAQFPCRWSARAIEPKHWPWRAD